MAQNRSKARKEWRRNRAQERKQFGNVYEYMALKAVEQTPPSSEFPSLMKYRMALGAKMKELKEANPMWVESQQRQWAMEPRP